MKRLAPAFICLALFASPAAALAQTPITPLGVTLPPEPHPVDVDIIWREWYARWLAWWFPGP